MRRFVVALIALIGLVLAGFTPVAAYAAESSLRIDKRVDDLDVQDQLGPGDEFTYTVDLFCDDVDCVNVVLTDTLPAEFAGTTGRETFRRRSRTAPMWSSRSPR